MRKLNREFSLLIREVDLAFDELTEFEDGEPQPRKDPTIAFWLNGLKHEDNGAIIDTKNQEVLDFVDLIFVKRQTKEGIVELRQVVDKKLEELN